MPSLRRRTLLGALATGFAGCSSSCPDADRPEPSAVVRPTGDGSGFETLPDGTWPTPRYDAANTGFAPDRHLPEDPALRWRASVTAPTSPPTVADGRVYLATAAGVVALSLRNGTERWRNQDVVATGDRALAPPVVGDRFLHVPSTDGVLALRPGDGSVAWRWTAASPTAVPAVADGGLFVPTADGVVSLAVRDGARRWEIDGGVTARPAVTDGTVIVAGESLVAVDAATGDRRWDAPTRTDAHPVVGDRTVFLGTNAGVVGLRLDDGTERWSVDRGGGRTFTAPVVTPETVYAVERPGEAPDATFALDRRSDDPPEPRWCSRVGEGVVTAAVDDHALTLAPGDADDASSAGVVLFTERFGEATWGYAVDRPLAPAVLDGAVVVADRRGTVAALGGE